MIKRSAETWPVLHGRFTDGSGYAINVANPSGALYLTAEAMDLLPTAAGAARVGTFDKVDPRLSRLLPHPTSAPVEIGRRPKSLQVWLHVANACNLSCGYCYIPDLQKGISAQGASIYSMSDAVVEESLQFLLAVCAEEGFRRLVLKFAGGEPSLVPELIAKTCQRAVELGLLNRIEVAFKILTNGVALDDGLRETLSRWKFGVSISVDGEPDAHDAVRFIRRRTSDAAVATEQPGPGSWSGGTWSRVERTIERFHEVGIKPFILCTVTPRNHSRLGGMVAYCRDRGLGFRLSPVRDDRAALDGAGQLAMTRSLMDTYRTVAVDHPLNMPIERYAGFAEWNLSRTKSNACGSCSSMLAVSESGEVASCQMRLDHPVTNVGAKSAPSVFQNLRSDPDYEFIAHAELRSGDCAECSLQTTCAGGCPEHIRSIYGSPNHASPWCGLFSDLLPVYVKAVAYQVKRAVDGLQVSDAAHLWPAA